MALASSKRLQVPAAFDARDVKLLDEYAAAVLTISARFRWPPLPPHPSLPLPLPPPTTLAHSEAEFGKGLYDWVEIIVKTNGYFTETKPWELKKKDAQRFEAVVCGTGGNVRVCVCVCASTRLCRFLPPFTFCGESPCILFNSMHTHHASLPARLLFTHHPLPQAAAARHAFHRLLHSRLVLRASGCSPPQPPASGARRARFESGDDGCDDC